MAEKFKISRWIKIPLKVIFWVVFSVVALTASAWLLLQTHWVQNYLTDKAMIWLSDKTDHTVSIDNIRINWFDEVDIEGFELRDFMDTTMVSVGRIGVNYDLWELIETKNLEVEEIYLERGGINLLKHTDSSELNINVFLKSLKNLRKDTTDIDTTASPPLYLERLLLEDFRFSMHDLTKERAEKGPDFSQIDLYVIFAEMSRIGIKPDSISMEIERFMGADPANKIHLSELAMKVGFTNKNLILDDVNIQTPYSSLGDSIVLSYNSATALSSFQDSVDIYMRITNTHLGKGDFVAMTGSNALNDDINLDAILMGKLDDLRLRDMNIRFGKSFLKGDISVIGLPKIEETFFDLNIRNASFFKRDIGPYMGKNVSFIDGIDRADVVMTFSGFLNDFSTKLTAKTVHGGIYADMNVVVPKDKDLTSYTGHLELRKLDVGRIIGDTALVQKVSLKGRVIGKGITKETVTFLTDFSATDVGVKGYNYDSIGFKGFLAAKHFYGHFSIADPNCKISGRTNVDLRKSPEQLSLNVNIDTLFTKKLRLTERDIFLKTKLNWQQKHLDVDSISGSLRVTQTTFRLDSVGEINLKELSIHTSLDSLARRLHLSMPGVDVDLDGNYTFKSLGVFIGQQAKHFKDYFDLSAIDLDSTAIPMKAKLKAKLGDLKPYTDFLAPELTISKGVEIDLGLEQREGSDAIISLYAEIDSIRYAKDVFYENVVDVYASASSSSDDILASFLITSSKQQWNAVPYSERFIAEGVWENKEIELSTSIHQPETSTRVNLASHIQLSNDSINFNFKSSELSALGQTWRFDPKNQISFSKRGLRFTALDILSENKRASLNGLLSETENSTVHFEARNINLQQFNSVLGIPVEGVFEADITFFKQLGLPIQFDGDFNLYDFVFKENAIGNIRGRTYYDLDAEGIHAWLAVERENFNAMSIDGFYYPEREEQLDFNLNFDRADLEVVELATVGILSGVKGTANGKMKIVGPQEKPRITGYMDLKDVKFKVDYLGTEYETSGRILVKEEQIELEKFQLKDIDGDIAKLTGNIKHKNFGDITFDLHIDARDKNFSFLNTTALDNDLYYGTAIASGDISVTGPLDDLLLKVNARTEKGTRFFIPLSETDAYEQADFMSFVNFSDTTRAREEALEAAKQSLGLTVEFDLEITTDAYCEIIFDIKTGDIIRGRGQGNLKLKLDKNGNFELFGPLTLTEGAYNFTVPNFINKEFEVVPGSTLAWYGDPLQGVMDMQATYRQKAAFGDLTGDESAEMTQKQPVIVLLKLSGPMLAPTIDFGLALDESISQNNQYDNLLKRISSDEQQLKRQVVSLMFFKRFSPLESSFVGGGGSGVSIGKSLSEFLTNQISYMASQLDENLEVEVDLTNMDEEGFNTFQLRLAYTFMDGRLKVSRGGDFSSSSSANGNAVNDIIGDWSVEYMLTKDGKLRAKMFSQSNQNQIRTAGQTGMETGMSLKYVTSFNNFKELLTRARAEAIQRKDDDDDEVEDISEIE
jgi:hypothetical protein